MRTQILNTHPDLAGVDPSTLSAAALDAKSIHVDVSEVDDIYEIRTLYLNTDVHLDAEDGPFDELEVTLITDEYGEVHDCEENRERLYGALVKEDVPYREAERIAYEDVDVSDFYEQRSDYVSNWLWPIPACRLEPETIMGVFRDLPFAVTIYEAGYEPNRDEDYTLSFSLTGGGQDFTWQIAEAYVRLGYLPPIALCELPNEAGRGYGGYSEKKDAMLYRCCIESTRVALDRAVRRHGYAVEQAAKNHVTG